MLLQRYYFSSNNISYHKKNTGKLHVPRHFFLLYSLLSTLYSFLLTLYSKLHTSVAFSSFFIIENMKIAEMTQRIINTPQTITNESPVFQMELMTDVR